eukprot:2632718-Prymnesium_polylepis.1
MKTTDFAEEKRPHLSWIDLPTETTSISRGSRAFSTSSAPTGIATVSSSSKDSAESLCFIKNAPSGRREPLRFGGATSDRLESLRFGGATSEKLESLRFGGATSDTLEPLRLNSSKLDVPRFIAELAPFLLATDSRALGRSANASLAFPKLYAPGITTVIIGTRS